MPSKLYPWKSLEKTTIFVNDGFTIVYRFIVYLEVKHLKKIFYLFCFIFMSVEALATHNRAGDITYVQIGPLRIRATVTTYTKTSSTGADRDSIQVFWGDGQNEWVHRVNGMFNRGEPLENDVKKNLYVAEHTYPGIGTYTINMTDPNRVGNILNLNYPNSIGVQFHLVTTFTLLNSTIQGYNNSVVLLQPPIDFGCIGKRFVYNLNAYDPDGDSLSFELIVPFQATGSEVPNYRFPDQIVPGTDNKISLDKNTGNFVWESPQREGEYNIAFLIKEYRSGILLNSVVRDMQITIENCNNDPPQLTVPNEICVVAGTRIEFTVRATDKTDSQKIALSALGGPFNQFVNKAEFIVAKGFQRQPATGKFVWQTSCEHISDVPYSVVFRAVDNFKDTIGLADLKSVRIKIVGPPPENLKAVAIGNTQAKLTWEYPNACAVTVNNYFKGFSIWRKINSNQFVIDSCQTGLAGRGYIKIASNVNSKNGDIYFFDDDMLDGGNTYCYRILAEFAFTSPGGNSYNRVVSIPSDEVCIQLKRDLPFITKVSVTNTDKSIGSILLEWSMPAASDLDTVKNPGPYKVVISKIVGINTTSTFIPIAGATFTSSTYAGFIDTSYSDINLNTTDNLYSYRLDFFAGNLNTPFGTSFAASSVYLSSVAADRTVKLNWKFSVPWNNFNYEVYRKINNAGNFELIGNSMTNSYIDRNLTNGILYCYKIQSIGSYGISGVPSPLFNFSEEICSIPLDTSAPCAPLVVIIRNCSSKDPSGHVINEISWSLKGSDSCFIDDTKEVRIYYKNHKDGDPILINTITDLSITTFNHTPDSSYTGCYIITAIDKNNNESKKLGEICPQPCQLEYELPNSFTPNNDGANDLFIPLINSGVIKVKFEVFNRWGELLYATEDPAIQWNGKDQAGKDISDGVYYYTCLLNGFLQNNNVSVEERKGFIQVIH
ncbi:MAG: gliding motility-associated C-terminal domain-containing protein [Saprospiraceae bacterium]